MESHQPQRQSTISEAHQRLQLRPTDGGVNTEQLSIAVRAGAFDLAETLNLF